ncbi:extracellular solute-binding protein [Marinomonas ostreistagni]|uniref:extracellular solute-binding protein n=1 Tax=Marinomonas ostreistagni TaxID=359209 RepID=UPI0019519C7C|nr:extracellular solute-binding protein [Marinomonas ostreistagni]MBM6550317.1 extracellular solute-binding protein [Marinomonas ostreistagni]
MRHFSSTALCMLLVASNAAAAEPRPTLTFLTWEDYISDEVIDQWYAKTGIPVKQVLFDDEAQRNLILTGSTVRQIDLAIVDRSSMDVLSRTGQLYPVRKSKGREAFFPDACGTYGQQYAWGSYGITYREDKLATPPTSWKALLNPTDEMAGHIGMLGQADELLAAALFALELSPVSNENNDLKSAFELLKQQSASVYSYEYIYTYISDNPKQDDIWVAPAYSGDQLGLNELQNTDAWRFVVPEDGSMVWIDCLAIPSKSTLKEQAQQFIDFLSEAKISALNSEELGVATPFKDAWQLQSEDVKQDGSVYLTAEQLDETRLFSGFKGTEILQRTRIKDALLRYHDTH